MSQLPDERIYYAQNREDLIIESFFPEEENGFYVDVGACHPDVASVTKRFYLKGWMGINIEPQANLFKLFETERKKDLNLNLGVSDKETELILRSYVNDQGRSTISSNMQNEYKRNNVASTEQFEDIKVRVVTLQQILKEHKVQSIQFLKVDVEGHEYEVLAGNDWSLFRPEVICIEADHVVKDWRKLLEENNYQKVFFDGLNEYYVDSNTNRASKFNYVGHVVMGLKGGVSAEDFEKQEAYKKEIDQKQVIIDSLEKNLYSTRYIIKRLKEVLLSRLSYNKTKK